MTVALVYFAQAGIGSWFARITLWLFKELLNEHNQTNL